MNKDLRKLIKAWHDCARCPLGADPRVKRHVFYRGEAPCDVLFIGEAPGKDENLIGQPFIGYAGDTLDAMIQAAADETKVTITGKDAKTPDDLVFGSHEPFSYGITNVVCCMPLNEDGKIRAPKHKEAKACNPRLVKTIEIASPKLIVLLGQTAKTNFSVPDSLSHIPVLELQHPAYINYNGGVGSITYDQNLVRLVAGLESKLYGEEESSQKKRVKKKAKPSSKEKRPKKKRRPGQAESYRTSEESFYNR